MASAPNFVPCFVRRSVFCSVSCLLAFHARSVRFSVVFGMSCVVRRFIDKACFVLGFVQPRVVFMFFRSARRVLFDALFGYVCFARQFVRPGAFCSVLCSATFVLFAVWFRVVRFVKRFVLQGAFCSAFFWQHVLRSPFCLLKRGLFGVLLGKGVFGLVFLA